MRQRTRGIYIEYCTANAPIFKLTKPKHDRPRAGFVNKKCGRIADFADFLRLQQFETSKFIDFFIHLSIRLQQKVGLQDTHMKLIIYFGQDKVKLHFKMSIVNWIKLIFLLTDKK